MFRGRENLNGAIMYTPDGLKQEITPIILMMNGLVGLLPTATRSKVQIFLDILDKQWFLELVCYLLNTFISKEPTKEELSEALKFFASETKIAGSAPVEMTTT